MGKKEKKCIKWLGLDFGSSSTKSVGITAADEEKIEFTVEGEFDTAGDGRVLTALKKNSDGEYELLQKGDAESWQESFYYDIKEKAVQPEGAEQIKAFVKAYLSKIISGEGDYDFSELSHVCFGNPAYFQMRDYDKSDSCDGKGADKSRYNDLQIYNKNIKEAIKEFFGENSKDKPFHRPDLKVENCPEPELALRAYHDFNKDKTDMKGVFLSGNNIMVLDIGGYTIDIVIMTVLGKGEESELRRTDAHKPLSKDFSRCLPLGKHLTMEIYSKFNGGEKRFDKKVEEMKVAYLREASREKCDISDTIAEGLTPVTGKSGEKYKLSCFPPKDEDGASYIHLFGKEDDKCLDFDATIKECTSIVLANIDNVKLNIDYILFTGGSSRITDLRKDILKGVKYSSKMQCDPKELSMDDDKHKGEGGCYLTTSRNSKERYLCSETAVAVGAAIYAKGLSEGIIQKNDDFVGGSESVKYKDPEVERLTAEVEMLKCALEKKPKNLEEFIKEYLNAEKKTRQ